MMPTDASLMDSCVSDCCSFTSLTYHINILIKGNYEFPLMRIVTTSGYYHDSNHQQSYLDKFLINDMSELGHCNNSYKSTLINCE